MKVLAQVRFRFSAPLGPTQSECDRFPTIHLESSWRHEIEHLDNGLRRNGLIFDELIASLDLHSLCLRSASRLRAEDLFSQLLL
jgi:hypothetical protein